MRGIWKAQLVLTLTVSVCHGDAEHKDTLQRAFTLPAGNRTLTVDNVNGSIRVKGQPGNEVKVTVQEHWRAESNYKLEEGRKAVRLDITQNGGDIRFYVDGPFRQRDGRINFDGDPGYRVNYDFEITVPDQLHFTLKTINGGDIHAENVRGDFHVRNVNGAVELVDLAGAGSAHTVNGKIRASFRDNPAGGLSFKTVNGSIDAYFPAGLTADLRFRTMNGDAHTDFDVTALTAQAPETKQSGTRYIYRSNRMSGVRVGAGGPELKFETLNGAIRVQKRGNQK